MNRGSIIKTVEEYAREHSSGYDSCHVRWHLQRVSLTFFLISLTRIGILSVRKVRTD
jgi:hypothetical protein